MGRRTLQEVRDGSGDPFKCPGLVGEASQGSRTGLEVFWKVWDGSGDPPGGEEQGGGHSRRFGMVQGTFPRV